MKKISLTIMAAIAAVSTAVCGAYLLGKGTDIGSLLAGRECVELYAACLTESVAFAVISEYIFRE